MYIYLGGERVAPEEEILGIFDLDNTSTGRDTRAFLGAAQKNGRIVEVTAELPKSFVLCQRGDEARVFLTQVSSATLYKRAL